MYAFRLVLLRCSLASGVVALCSLAQANFQRYDPWLGQAAYWKDSAVARDGDATVDKQKTLAWPATVKAVQGDRLWVGRAWLMKSDVMTLPEAIDFYSLTVTRNPNDPVAWRRLGICRMGKRDWPAADKCFTTALGLAPSDYISLSRRSLARYYLHDYDGSIDDLNRMIELYPASGWVYRSRGMAKARKKSYAGAIRDFERANELDPKNVLGHIDCGVAKRLARDYDGATAEFEVAISLDPASPNGYVGRGSIERRKKDFASALRDFEKAIELDPRNPDAHGGRGAVKMEQQDYDSAAREFDTAIRCNPEDYYVLNGKALLLAVCPKEKYRDPKAALLLADQALQLEPGFAYAKATKACANALLGDFTKAIELQTEALQDDLYRAEERQDAEDRSAAWQKKEQWFFKPAK